MIKIQIVLALFCTVMCQSFANSVPHEQCFIDASKKYNVPKEILITVASVESKFNKNAINYNKNGTYDLGIMQINSRWFDKLSIIGIDEKMLKNPCQNIMIGAWVMAQKISAYGFNWVAIQRYNGSDTQLKYAQKIRDKLEKSYPQLFESGNVFVKSKTENKEEKSTMLYVN